jgi:ABC-type dipeptide/oligopeptide/nickel transport system permease component
MELIQIIYTLLVLGIIFLFAVVIISFIFSKSKAHEELNQELTNSNTPAKKATIEQQVSRKQKKDVYPQIFQISKKNPSNIKIVRKATFTKDDIKVDESIFSKSNGKGTRYKIVNEERSKSKSRFRASNF